MADGQIEGNGAVATAEPVTGQSVQAPVSTPSQNGQASGQEQSAPAEDTFSSIDPNTLPPELKAIYKNLQSDYTKKLQPVAELRKKAEAYDKASSDPRFVAYWKGLSQSQKSNFQEQKAEAEKTLGQKIPDERFQKAFETKDGFLELLAEVAKEVSSKDSKKIEELEQYKAVNETNSLVAQFSTEVGKDGKPLRPDFDSLEEDKLISGYLQLTADNANPLSKEEYVQKLHEAYAWAQALSQKYTEKGRQEALTRIQQKVASSSEPPTQAAKGAYTGPDPKKITPSEAFQLAKKGIRVPRDD